MTTPDDRIASVIDRLVDEARPVHRLWSPAVRLAGWVGTVFVVTAALVGVGLRSDVAARLAAPAFLAELACLAAATVAAAWIALRAAVPGLDAGRGRLVLAGTIVASVALSVVQSPPVLATSLVSFLDAGFRCLIRSIVLASVPYGVLLWAVRRGVPLRPARTYAVAGLAAFLAAYALMRLRCAQDETLHVAVWHGVPVVLATIAAAAMGVGFRRSAPPAS